MSNTNDDYDTQEAECEPDPPEPPFYTVAVFLEDRARGGPEEGGWYYTCGDRVDKLEENGKNIAIPQVCATLEEADAAYMKMTDALTGENKMRNSNTGSVLSEGKYVARVCEGYPDAYFPKERPYYC